MRVQLTVRQCGRGGCRRECVIFWEQAAVCGCVFRGDLIRVIGGKKRDMVWLQFSPCDNSNIFRSFLICVLCSLNIPSLSGWMMAGCIVACYLASCRSRFVECVYATGPRPTTDIHTHTQRPNARDNAKRHFVCAMFIFVYVIIA